MGLKRTADMNSAMLDKASWKIVQKDKGPWCQVLSKKYLQHKSIIDSSYNRHFGCSSTWSSVLHRAKLLHSGLCWRIGNDKSINF